jgi:hypothetical protein
MELQTLFWNATLDEITRGYTYNKSTQNYTCLMCGATFEKDVIYPVKEQFFNAHKAVSHHINEAHTSVFDYIISFNKSYTSLSENQKNVLLLMKQGLSDLEIAKELRITSSTIRNYRFKFREKEKQAKLFLALMKALGSETEQPDKIIIPHLGATCLDERYDITETDKIKTLQHYFNENGQLIAFPSKEKKKIIILTEIAKNFKPNQTYTEKEINRILTRIFDDFVILRRYLIQYGFLERQTDGTTYWVK